MTVLLVVVLVVVGLLGLAASGGSHIDGPMGRGGNP